MVISGESSFDSSMLNGMIEEAETERDSAETQVREIEAQRDDANGAIERFKEQYGQFMSWCEIYEQSSYEVKRMYFRN